MIILLDGEQAGAPAFDSVRKPAKLPVDSTETIHGLHTLRKHCLNGGWHSAPDDCLYEPRLKQRAPENIFGAFELKLTHKIDKAYAILQVLHTGKQLSNQNAQFKRERGQGVFQSSRSLPLVRPISIFRNTSVVHRKTPSLLSTISDPRSEVSFCRSWSVSIYSLCEKKSDTARHMSSLVRSCRRNLKWREKPSSKAGFVALPKALGLRFVQPVEKEGESVKRAQKRPEAHGRGCACLLRAVRAGLGQNDRSLC